METNEIMNNEEVIETTVEKVIETSSKDGLKVVAGVGLGIFAGMMAYKYIAQPIAAKLKVYYEDEKTAQQEDLESDFVEGEVMELKTE